MPILPRLLGVLRAVAGRGPVQRDLDDEVDSCLEMLVDEKVASGLDAEEARRQALLDMGGVEQVKDEVRAVRPAALLDTIARDVRYGFRLLGKTPAFSLTAILVLAAGIGANTAAFGVINSLWFQPLPGAGEPGEPVALYSQDPGKPDSYQPFSYADYDAVRGSATVFAHLMAHMPYQVGVTDGGISRRTSAEICSRGYFATLGVRLAAGRTFTPEEERPGSGAAVMVVSHVYWERLGNPADILGRTLLVDSHRFTVIGVAPAGFAGRMVLAGPEFWMPLGAAGVFQERDAKTMPTNLGVMVVGRLKPGVTLAAANASLRPLSDALPPRADGSERLLTVSRLSRFNQGNRPANDEDEVVFAFGALEGAALILLMIASLNVANMQLARGTSRRKEIAMRLALGASRGRIVGQMLIEGLILAAAGGLLGMLAGTWILDAVASSLAAVVDKTLTVDVWPDWRVTLACLACCSLSALAFALGPAWKLSRLDPLPEMRSPEGTLVGRGLRRLGPRNLLVAGQIALSLALLGAAGLFVRAAVTTGAAEPGYRFDRQFLVRLDAATGGLGEAAGREAYRDLIRTIRTTPGVESASVASYLAFSNSSYTRRVWRPGTSPGAGSRGETGLVVLSYDIGTAYFQTLGLSMLRGREFSATEEVDPAATGVAIVDEPLAAALFAGEDAIGQFVEFSSGSGQPNRVVQIVGLAPGLRHRLSDPGPVPHIYLPLGAQYRPALNVHVRAAAGGALQAGSIALALRDTIRGGNRGLAVLGIQTLDEARDAVPLNWVVRAAARTFGGFGAVAIFMATAGLYGVKAYLVARRTREIGIRMALGASANSVVHMVLKEGASLLGVSILVGFLLAVAFGQVVSSLLVGVRPFDPLVLAIATIVLATAVFTACYVPARRATRISPMRALRVE